jgi:hypothetical protein
MSHARSVIKIAQRLEHPGSLRGFLGHLRHRALGLVAVAVTISRVTIHPDPRVAVPYPLARRIWSVIVPVPAVAVIAAVPTRPPAAPATTPAPAAPTVVNDYNIPAETVVMPITPIISTPASPISAVPVAATPASYATAMPRSATAPTHPPPRQPPQLPPCQLPPAQWPLPPPQRIPPP